MDSIIIKKIWSKFHRLIQINFIKSIFLNFKLFDFKTACKLPCIVRSGVSIVNTKGKFKINGPVRFGMIIFGGGAIMIYDSKYPRTIIEIKGKVCFNGSANFGRGSVLSVMQGAELNLGNKFSITAASKIICYENIKIGNDCLISWECLIMDSDSHYTVDVGTNKINTIINKAVDIGNNCWLGYRVIVLKGAKIPSNTIIAASSLVNKSYINEGQNILIAGNPAVVKKRNIKRHIEE